MKRSVIYLFVSLFFVLTGCEYELMENYQDIEKPSEDTEMDIYLNIPDDGDGQLLIKDSYFVGYEINNSDFYVNKCVFRLGNKRWEKEGRRGQFSIDKYQFPNNVYELSCEVYGKRNNGSISDQIGSEMLLGKKTWPLRVFVADPSDRQLSIWLNDNGCVEIAWEIDEKYRASFDHYEIVVSRNNSTWTHWSKKFDLHSFEDYVQASGPVTYEVFYYPKEVTGRPFSLGKVTW